MNEMEKKISEEINFAIEKVIKERSNYYDTNPLPSKSDIENIITKCSYLNSTISFGSNLVLGPFGMLVTIPEIVAVIYNQIKMIYDIAVANGHQQKITPELIVGVMVSSFGLVAGNLLIIHGQRIVIKRVSAQILQRIVIMLGGRITQQVIARTTAKFIPVIGASAMAIWTKYTTEKIGEKAIEIFSKDITLEVVELEYKN